MRREPGTASPARHLVHDGKDLVIVLVLGGCVAAAGGIWLWGQIAAFLVGHWLHLTPRQVLGVLGRLPQHWDDPRRAWPAGVRAALPGPVVFVIAGVLLLLAVAVAVAAGVWAWARWRRRYDGFASRKDLALAHAESAVLARAGVVRPSLAGRRHSLEDVGVRLGRSIPDRMRLAVSAEDSVLVFAAPRQGKTSQVVIPWLAAWPGPALATSLRPDVLLATATLRAERGPVAVLAPTGMIDWPDLVAWSPTAGCADLDKARQRSELMVTVGRAERQDSSNAGYFGANAVNLLAGWLHAAAISGRGMLDVLGWSLDDQDASPIEVLRDHPDAAAGTAALLDGLYRTPPETKSGLWTTVQTALAPLLSTTAQATFCPPADHSFDLDQFLRANGTVYLLVADKQAQALAPLISAFVDELLETAKRVADAAPGGRLDPPLGLLLDEVANVAPLPSLPALMSFAGGSGIFVTGVLQSRAQAEARWGREQAAMLWGAATVKVILGGLSGDEPRQLSELAGEHERLLTSYQRSDDGSIVTQTSTQDKKSITPEQIRTLDASQRVALVLHATTPAVKVRMTRHYEGRDRERFAAAEAEARELLRQQSREAP